MSKKLYFLFFITLIFSAPRLNSQIVEVETKEPFEEDKIKEYYEKDEPMFSLFKDNYFIYGCPINKKPDAHNSDVKFQISFQAKLTRNTLPWGSYLYFYYTQKVFWNVLEESLPMRDLNFNPGIGIAKPLYSNGRYIGKIRLQVEHESNGKDEEASRSWNRVSLGANIIVDKTLMIHYKAWLPIVDGEHNTDLLDYVGIYQVGTQVMSENQKWSGSLILVKRKGWRLNYNVIAEVSYRFSKNSDWSIFAQYYCGYGEGLLDYKEHVSKLRAGIVIRPKFFSDY